MAVFCTCILSGCEVDTEDLQPGGYRISQLARNLRMHLCYAGAFKLRVWKPEDQAHPGRILNSVHEDRIAAEA